MRRDEQFLSEIATCWREHNRREQVGAEARRQSARGEAARLARAFAARDPELRRVYLFGSCLDGRRFTPTSDIDLAIDGGDLLSCVRIALKSSYPVDVIDLSEAGESLRGRILAHGELLYAKEH